MAQGGSIFPPLEDRPVKDTICLFDVDGTLTPARQVCSLSFQALDYLTICYRIFN